MCKLLFRSLVCLSVFVGLSGLAFAQDNCKKQSSNKKWIAARAELDQAMEAGNFDAAWEQALILDDICNRSAEVNYLTAQVAEARKDNESALYYYQQATAYATVSEVDPELAQKIWSARLRFEDPEHVADKMVELQSQNDAAQSKVAALESEIAALRESNARVNVLSQRVAELRDEYWAMTWVGTGIGIAGLGSLGAGLGLLLSDDDSCDVSIVDNGGNPGIKHSMHQTYSIGLILVGVGGALTVAGTVIAGIYGYRYTHTDAGTVSFDVSPVSASMRITF